MWLSFFNKLFSFPFLSILCWLVPLFSVNIFSCLSLATADMFFPHPWYIFLYAATIFSHLCFCFSYCLSQVTLFLLKVCLHCVCFFFFFLSISLLKQRSEVKVLRMLVPASWAEISPGEWGGGASQVDWGRVNRRDETGIWFWRLKPISSEERKECKTILDPISLSQATWVV